MTDDRLTALVKGYMAQANRAFPAGTGEYAGADYDVSVNLSHEAAMVAMAIRESAEHVAEQLARIADALEKPL